jgi:hypothetical protein
VWQVEEEARQGEERKASLWRLLIRLSERCEGMREHVRRATAARREGAEREGEREGGRADWQRGRREGMCKVEREQEEEEGMAGDRQKKQGGKEEKLEGKEEGKREGREGGREGGAVGGRLGVEAVVEEGGHDGLGERGRKGGR